MIDCSVSDIEAAEDLEFLKRVSRAMWIIWRERGRGK